MLFIHRDAENSPVDRRIGELDAAIVRAAGLPTGFSCSHVKVIPVRMTEAWLLIDEGNTRRAAGNPNGKVSLQMPRLRDLESIPNPKSMLHDLLRQASECTGRRLRNLRPAACVHRLAELIDDYSPLRRLCAFQRFERETREKLQELHYL
jgi:hypothetical protein